VIRAETAPALRFHYLVNNVEVLADDKGPTNPGMAVTPNPQVQFAGGDAHFLGLGHPAFGRMDSDPSLRSAISSPHDAPMHVDRKIPAQTMAPWKNHINRPIAKHSATDNSGNCFGQACFLESTLVVPFVISSRGYGIYWNNMFKSEFDLKSDDYHISSEGGDL